jgi:hypothetical protein
MPPLQILSRTAQLDNQWIRVTQRTPLENSSMHAAMHAVWFVQGALEQGQGGLGKPLLRTLRNCIIGWVPA